jgi:hypothetical protein
VMLPKPPPLVLPQAGIQKQTASARRNFRVLASAGARE